jgi:hypothetical protein
MTFSDTVAIGALWELLLAASDATAHDKAHWERLCQAKERARQVLSRSPAPSPSMEARKTAWMVERDGKWWGPICSEWAWRDAVAGCEPPLWTDNANAAVRFARKEDADAFIRWRSLGNTTKATEHVWLGATSPSVASPPPDIEKLIERLEREAPTRSHWMSKAAAAVRSLSARLREVEGALEPFAKEAETEGNVRLSLGSDIDHWPLGSPNGLTLGDLRRARAALTKPPGESDG